VPRVYDRLARTTGSGDGKVFQEEGVEMGVASSEQATREGLALDAGTLCDAFQRTARVHAQGVALRTLGGEQEITWAEYSERVRTAPDRRARSTDHPAP
jgi:hypothetical protein